MGYDIYSYLLISFNLDWYEGSEWTFNDGNYSLTVSYAHGDSSPKPIIALGRVSIEAYADFFGIQNLCVGEYVYILFDIDGDVDGSDLAVFVADFGRTDCPLVNQQESLKNENQLLREEIERLKAENLILRRGR